MSERLTALGMGVLVSCFVLLAVHSVGRADEPSKDPFAGPAKASEGATAAASGRAADEKGDVDPVARIRAALDRPITVEFIEMPLEDVVAGLDESLKVPILLDRRALNEMGIGSDVPITRAVKGMRLAAFLDLALGDLDLTWVIHNEVLLITTPEQAGCLLETRVLDVADLASGRDAAARLAVLLRTVVNPTTWATVGGPASVGYVETSKIRTLVISQAPRTHDEITQLVADLRSKLPKASAEPRSPASVAAAHIEKELATKTKMDFVDTPLADVVDYLKEYHSIGIQIDRRSLDEKGIGIDTPVTFSLSGVSTESALNLLLRDLDLTFTQKDNMLLILTKEAEASDLRVKVYPVGDLTKDNSNGVEELAMTVKQTIAPESWNEVGGPAAIVPFKNAGMKVLVVSQTWNVHRKIGRLFADLRSARHDQ